MKKLLNRLSCLAIAFLLIVVFSVFGGMGGHALFAATSSGDAGEENITFETLSTNTTTGSARLSEAYWSAIYEFSLTGTADKEIHIKHRIGNTSRFTNATSSVIRLKAGEWWDHRVRINNDGVQEAKIQCVAGCATGETVTARGYYIK